LGGSPTSHSYDKADRVQAVGGTTYNVDANGNLTNIASSPNASTLAYHRANRLTSVTVGGTTTSYTYDVNGSLPVVLSDGTLGYVYGLADTISTNVSHTLQVLYTDGLGSVRAIIDSPGSLLQTFQTDEFGNQALAQGACKGRS
jgi:hypothetical protein